MVRFRSRLWIALFGAGTAAACSFGVDLDRLVGGDDLAPDAGLSDSNPPIITPPAESGPDGSPIASVDIEQIGSGSGFTCARKSTGVVACWGRGTEGRLGDGTAATQSTPADVRDLTDAIDLAVGSAHACVIKKDGSVYCWGLNDARQLGNGTTSEGRTPQPTIGVNGKATMLAAGASFTCAVLEDKTVSCWGDNTHGQLGAGDLAPRTAPVAVKDLTDVKQVSTTVTAACALTNGGDVYCWGDNEDGQSGSGDAGGIDLSTPRKVESLANVSSLSTGGLADHFCAVMSGEVKCWGANDTGSLGSGGTGDSAIPVSVVTLKDITSVASGGGYSCAIHQDGSVSCWGTNTNRQLAIGDAPLPATTNTPLKAQGLSEITLMGAGATHACALKGKREVQCWGSDVYGALGRKRPVTSNVPVKVASPTELKAIANGRIHACAADADGGAVSCWGDNGYRQLGRGDVPVAGLPAPVAGLGGVTKLAAGDTHSCALLGDGGVRCWGGGDYGALGHGSSPFAQTTPVAYASPEATAIGLGLQYTCVLLKSGNVSCSGLASDGRLGSPGTNTSTPRLVLAPSDGGAAANFGGVSALAVGRYHACVIYNGGKSLACWGNNENGQLGRAASGASSSATDVPLPKSPVQVACGYRHTCARVSGNETLCWGRNVNGQLTGTEGSGHLQRTVTFPGDHYATDLALGDDHSCAILDDKTVACWGAGTLGQLGNGQSADSNRPVLVSGVTGATAITAEEHHSCAITPTGTFCWGTDMNGQLGVAPVMVTGIPAGVEGL